MSLTILEVLINAKINLQESLCLSDPISMIQKELGYRQLQNAVKLLSEKNKNIHDDFNEDDLKKE